jgi:hypothetical protein
MTGLPSTPSPKKRKEKGMPLIPATKKNVPQLYLWQESKNKRKPGGKWVKDSSPPRKKLACPSP